MLGRMNIDKATKFFRDHQAIYVARIQVKPDHSYNFVAQRWNHLENMALNDFKRKYRLELSLEQRWHIFLSIMSNLPFPIDKSLGDFLQSGINDIATWSVKAKSQYRELDYPDNPSVEVLLKGFPYFPLFMYSLNNHEIIYPNNPLAKSIIEHLQQVEQLKGHEEIWGWYSRGWGMHKLQTNS